MKILIVGGGGREHALAWKLAQNGSIDKLYCAPGNAGIKNVAECIPIKAEDLDGLLQFAKSNKIDLTIVGPEVPLSLGIADLFEANGLRIFGVNKKAAELESSKAFSKELMERYDIPTARHCTYSDISHAINGIDAFGFPVVIKADGLAGGKGVVIAHDRAEAIIELAQIMNDGKFGQAGRKIVIEEFLEGKEVSVLAFVDGNIAVPMVDAQDYKKAFNNDKGLNTGGMGAISPSLHYSSEHACLVKESIIDRTLAALKAEGIVYKGILYFGLMLTKLGPKVIEYNCRFGDPEAEVVLPRLETDLLEIMKAVIDGRLGELEIKWKDESAVCVVMASGGYPEAYNTGYEIFGLDETDENMLVFHAGTKAEGSSVVTAGGRVLVPVALGTSVDEARSKVYNGIKKLNFNNMHYREDIGKRMNS